jgi:hypothetical protein
MSLLRCPHVSGESFIWFCATTPTCVPRAKARVSIASLSYIPRITSLLLSLREELCLSPPRAQRLKPPSPRLSRRAGSLALPRSCVCPRNAPMSSSAQCCHPSQRRHPSQFCLLTCCLRELPFVVVIARRLQHRGRARFPAVPVVRTNRPALAAVARLIFVYQRCAVLGATTIRISP